MMRSDSVLFDEVRLGTLTLPNRFVRAGTSETMATAEGEVTDDLVALYRQLARGGAGLIFSGHMFVHPRGRHAPFQTGIDRDSLIPGLQRLADAVHREGGRIFAQLNHAGSQSVVKTVTPVVPSAIVNARTGRTPLAEASAREIDEAVRAFGDAARRARQAGFDGIHIHAANGYLISNFSSPYSNRRTDEWGGDAQRRGLFIEAVYRSVRDGVGAGTPVTLKLGVADCVEGGVEEPESVERAVRLEELGLDALEVSCGMHRGRDSSRLYVAVSRKRAWDDRLYHRLLAAPDPEAYFANHARAMKRRLKIPIVLVGGLRSTETMEQMVQEGTADFVAMARPFIREPDIVNQIARGRRGLVDCTSCNICLHHEGRDSLRCWRRSRATLLDHAWKTYVRDVIHRAGPTRPQAGTSAPS